MKSLASTRRVTGLLYLALAVTGALSFVVIRPRIFAAGDAATTLANLIADENLARWGIALELGVVLVQAVLALWFYRLFRTVNQIAAIAIMAFGLINAVAILAATMFWSTAIAVAIDPTGASAPGGDAAATALLLFDLHNAAWAAGNLFFGLWLIPMGIAVLAAKWVRALGWALIVGGVAYVLSAFILVLAPGLSILAEALAILATVGEVWIIGYLLFTRSAGGDRQPAQHSAAQISSSSAR